MKKIITLFLICLCFNVSFLQAVEPSNLIVNKPVDLEFNTGAEILTYQQIKEKDVQSLVDRIFGPNQVMISLKVRVKVNIANAQKIQTLFLPGVPIKQISKANIQNAYVFSHYEVNVSINSAGVGEKTVVDKVKAILDFDQYKDSTLKVMKEKFSNSGGQTAEMQVIKAMIDSNTNTQKSADDKFNALLQSSLQQQELSAKESEKTLGFVKNELKSGREFIGLLLNNASGKVGVREIITIVLGSLLILVMAGIAFALFTLSRSATHLASTASESTGESSGSSSGGFHQGPPGSGGGVGGVAMGSVVGEMSGTGGLGADELTFKESSAIRDYFDFVTDSNIIKLAYLLERDKPQPDSPDQDTYWQKVAIIISYLPTHMSAVIFSRFTTEEQTEIIPFLTYEVEHPVEEIFELEKLYKDKVACLIGGKHAVLPLIDRFPADKKSELTMALHEKYPDVLFELRDMIVLFEDVIALPQEELLKVFMELDPDILALILIGMDESERDKKMEGLAEGLIAMVREVIDLRKDSYAPVEIDNAKGVMVKVAKALKKMGRISLVQKEFGVDEAKMEQDDIDSLFK